MEIFRRSKHHTGEHLHFAFRYELPRPILNINYMYRFFFPVGYLHREFIKLKFPFKGKAAIFLVENIEKIFYRKMIIF